jgi:hypothetical protein
VRLLEYSLDDSEPCKQFARIERVIRRSRTSSRKEAVLSGKVDPWGNPTFWDHMMIREFVDEQTRRRGFYRAYPKRKTMDRYEKCFDRLTYEDLVLHSWLKKDHDGRMAALRVNWEKHRAAMNTVFPKPGEAKTECDVE